MMKNALFCSGGQGPESQYTPEMTYAPKRAVDWDACADEEISLTFYVKLPGSLVVDTKNGMLSDIVNILSTSSLGFIFQW